MKTEVWAEPYAVLFTAAFYYTKTILWNILKIILRNINVPENTYTSE